MATERKPVSYQYDSQDPTKPVALEELGASEAIPVEDGGTGGITPEEARTNLGLSAGEIKTLYESIADTNAFTDAEKTKLSGIESGATADQTGAEIKTAYEAESNTNAYTDSEKSKLAGVETGATADQTGAEIKSLYEIQPDAFTDPDRLKLDGIENNATADQTGPEIKALYEAESDTNEFSDAEKLKLAGIEEGATAGGGTQTGAEIKTLYEGEADTNAFTDAEQTKLAGIEANATTDQSGAEIKAAYEGEADTNAYTDAEKSKLGGIAAGANVGLVNAISQLGDIVASGSQSIALTGDGTWVSVVADNITKELQIQATDDLSDLLEDTESFMDGNIQTPSYASKDFFGAFGSGSNYFLTNVTGGNAPTRPSILTASNHTGQTKLSITGGTGNWVRPIWINFVGDHEVLLPDDWYVEGKPVYNQTLDSGQTSNVLMVMKPFSNGYRAIWLPQANTRAETLVWRQKLTTGAYVTSQLQLENAGSLVTDDLYSRLGSLEDYRCGDGRFHFSMRFLSSAGANTKQEVYDWKQFTNPVNPAEPPGVVNGYQVITDNLSDLDIGGLTFGGICRTKLIYDNWFSFYPGDETQALNGADAVPNTGRSRKATELAEYINAPTDLIPTAIDTVEIYVR